MKCKHNRESGKSADETMIGELLNDSLLSHLLSIVFFSPKFNSCVRKEGISCVQKNSSYLDLKISTFKSDDVIFSRAQSISPSVGRSVGRSVGHAVEIFQIAIYTESLPLPTITRLMLSCIRPR